MQTRYYWKPLECEILLNHFNPRKKNTAEICRIKLWQAGFKRSRASIGTKYYRMLRGTPKRTDLWGELQLDILRKYSGILTAEQIGKRMKKSALAVEKKAQKLGISLKLDKDYYNLLDLAEMLGTTDDWVSSYIKPVLAPEVKTKQREYRFSLKQIRWYFRTRPEALHMLIESGKKPDGYFLVDMLAGILT